jgi:hypothetical protein
MQVTNPCVLFHRLKINHKSHRSYAVILEKGAVTNNEKNSSGFSNMAFFILLTPVFRNLVSVSKLLKYDPSAIFYKVSYMGTLHMWI